MTRVWKVQYQRFFCIGFIQSHVEMGVSSVLLVLCLGMKLPWYRDAVTLGTVALF